MWLLPLLIILASIALSIPSGLYLARIMDGRYQPPRWLAWCEGMLNTGPQSWKKYALSLLFFNLVMFLVTFGLLCLQPLTPLNPDGKGALAPTTIFNTAVSFLTNTNLQHYSGEQHLSYFSQLSAILWSMFVSPAVGFAALTAMIRGLRGDKDMGNFYLDMWRAVMYVLVPASLVVAVLLLATGVPMTVEGSEKAATVEQGSMGKDADGNDNPQEIARGPVAALMPIKHLGSNGGGFFGANSAHPFENPTAWSNIIHCICILLFPMASVVMFGRMLANFRHAAVVGGVMLLLLVVLTVWAICWDSLAPNPGLTEHRPRALAVTDEHGKVIERNSPPIAALPVDQELGNLEGKELRFGTSAGASFSAITTAVACGAVNCMHDSLNPMAGLTPLSGMWLNCIFGGKGVGTINFLLYLIVGVFLSGLMVGRTPEYLGKKVEAREMKLAMLALLVHPILVLGPTGFFASSDFLRKSTNNPGAHGFAEILYEFSSSSANNGSGFEGLQDTWGLVNPDSNPNPPSPYSPYWDIATGIVMLLGRFLPIVAPLALAGALAAKKSTPFTVGTMRTDTITFGFVLLGTILLVGALLFMPAAILGPAAEHLGPIPFGN
jgi:K+-transporting ATPase ATPase A chain